MVQDTKNGNERNHPISLLYYFGQAKKLKERVTIESVVDLNDWFHMRLGETLSNYMLALTRLANGDMDNINFQKINQTSHNKDCAVTQDKPASPKSDKSDFAQS